MYSDESVDEGQVRCVKMCTCVRKGFERWQFCGLMVGGEQLLGSGDFVWCAGPVKRTLVVLHLAVNVLLEMWWDGRSEILY